MSSMFWGAYSFNQDLSSWDVSQVTDMSSMFGSASSFNQDLSPWDVSQVTDMSSMFSSASSFSQTFCWHFNPSVDTSDFLYGAYNAAISDCLEEGETNDETSPFNLCADENNFSGDAISHYDCDLDGGDYDETSCASGGGSWNPVTCSTIQTHLGLMGATGNSTCETLSPEITYMLTMLGAGNQNACCDGESYNCAPSYYNLCANEDHFQDELTASYDCRFDNDESAEDYNSEVECNIAGGTWTPFTCGDLSGYLAAMGVTSDTTCDNIPSSVQYMITMLKMYGNDCCGSEAYKCADSDISNPDGDWQAMPHTTTPHCHHQENPYYAIQSHEGNNDPLYLWGKSMSGRTVIGSHFIGWSPVSLPLNELSDPSYFFKVIVKAYALPKGHPDRKTIFYLPIYGSGGYETEAQEVYDQTRDGAAFINVQGDQPNHGPPPLLGLSWDHNLPNGEYTIKGKVVKSGAGLNGGFGKRKDCFKYHRIFIDNSLGPLRPSEDDDSEDDDSEDDDSAQNSQ